MSSVTVDYDDLQTLLFATNAIQGVEAALKARERDPLVLSTKGKLSSAHDRLSDAWRKSKREAPPEPDEQDIEKLRRMFSGGQTEAVVESYPMRLAQVLQLVESGPLWYGTKIDWPAPSSPEFRQATTDPHDLRWGVRLTARGEAVVGPREVVDEREELIREIVSRPNRLPSSVEEAGPPGKFHRTGYLDQSRAEITVAGLSEPNEYPGGPLIIP